MADSAKKQNFLHGAALLAIATAVVKVVGALYKIPLKMVIGDQGYGYFCTAYDIYSVLLMVATAGLPVAMSRMISKESALGQYNQVRRVYKAARGLFLGLGLISGLLMFLFCRELAAFQGQPDAWASVACLAPCAVLMGIMSTYRGFFQGQGNMRPTSNSQMLEAVVKLIIGLAAAYGLMLLTQSVALAASGAILGVTISCVVSVLYLTHKFLPTYRAMPQTNEQVQSYRQTIKGLLAIAIPITIGSAGLQLLTVLETSLYMGQLRTVLDSGKTMSELLAMLESYGYAGEVPLSLLTREAAIQYILDTQKGIYNMTQTVFNMPCSFIVPITVSVLPAVTAQLTLNNHPAVRQTEESAARITGLISLPCAVGLCLMAAPVMSLLGGYSGVKLELASPLLAILGICVFLYAVVQYTNAIMQAHGYAHVPVINMLLAGTMKLVVVYIFVGNPDIGILGAPLGAVLCYLCIALLNLIAIRKCVPQKPALLRNLLRPALPALVMGVAVYGSYLALLQVLGSDASRIVLCGVPIGVGVAVYCLMAAWLKAITREDCQLLPKGEKLARILHL